MTTARKLQKDYNYKEWRNFNTLILRAKNLIANGVENGVILDIKHTVPIGSGAVRIIDDYELDNDAENLIKKLSLSYKLGGSYTTRNETAILGLLQKYCIHKGFLYDFQFKLDKYIYDFCCEHILIEFDEPHHQNSRQNRTDLNKENTAIENGYKLFRFTLKDDVVDMIKCIESNVKIVKTIECSCGYIATFESKLFVCPDCGASYRLK